MLLPTEIFLLIVENLLWKDFKTIRLTSASLATLLAPKLLGYKLLHMLVHQRYESRIVRFLERYRHIDIGVRGKYDMSALHYIARRGYNKVLCKLLCNARYRALVDCRDSYHSSTPLIIAARIGSYQSVRLLLGAGAFIGARNSEGECPLYWAITRGEPTLVQILLQSGARPKQTVRNGFTPLTLAVLGIKPEVAALLLHHGADINQHDGRGYTALSWAVISRNLPMAQFLLQNGADPSRPDDRRKLCRTGHETPLIWAILTRNPAMVRLLVEAGADVQIGGGPGKFSPITWAIVLRDLSTTAILVQHGADIWERDENGQAPFDFAVISKSKDMLQLLLTGCPILHKD